MGHGAVERVFPQIGIRQAIVEADLVDCMVALPGQLFYSTQIPVCLWFLTRNKAARTIKHAGEPLPDFIRDRKGETLFIDARKMGRLIDRVNRVLTEEDIHKIALTYQLWKEDYGKMMKEAERQEILFEHTPPSLIVRRPGGVG